MIHAHNKAIVVMIALIMLVSSLGSHCTLHLQNAICNTGLTMNQNSS